MKEIVFNVKKIRKRKQGGCVGAVAYAAGLSLKLEEKDESWNYSRRKDVLADGMAWPSSSSPASWTLASFWNLVSEHHSRKDAVVGYSLVVALPLEIGNAARVRLVEDLADLIAKVHGVAVHWAIHRPRPVTPRELELNPHQHFVEDEETEGLHNGNWHAHLCITACSVDEEGRLGRKVEELDPVRASVLQIVNFARVFRYCWTVLLNHARDRANSPAPRLSHRSLAARGIDRKPKRHLGPRLAHAVRTYGSEAVAARVPWFRRHFEEPRPEGSLPEASGGSTTSSELPADLEREQQEALMRKQKAQFDAHRKMLGVLDSIEKSFPVDPQHIRLGVPTERQAKQDEYDRLLKLLDDSQLELRRKPERAHPSSGDPPAPKRRDLRRRPS